MHKQHQKTSTEDTEHDPWVDGTSSTIHQLNRIVLIGKLARSKQATKICS